MFINNAPHAIEPPPSIAAAIKLLRRAKRLVKNVPHSDPANCEGKKKLTCKSLSVKCLARIGNICPIRTVAIPDRKNMICRRILSNLTRCVCGINKYCDKLCRKDKRPKITDREGETRFKPILTLRIPHNYSPTIGFCSPKPSSFVRIQVIRT